jgi:hypothetical protein
MRLSKIQWTEIVECSGLPPDARPQIEKLIRTYRDLKALHAPYHSSEKIRDQLNKANKCALALRTELHKLYKNNRALSALAAATDQNNALAGLFKPTARLRLEKASLNINDLMWWFRSAHKQVGRSKPGPHTRDAYSLVASLDQIIEKFKGNRISRSYKSTSKNYVTKIVKIADPKIGRGTIDAAMRACIYRRGRKPD